MQDLFSAFKVFDGLIVSGGKSYFPAFCWAVQLQGLQLLASCFTKQIGEKA